MWGSARVYRDATELAYLNAYYRVSVIEPGERRSRRRQSIMGAQQSNIATRLYTLPGEDGRSLLNEGSFRKDLS